MAIQDLVGGVVAVSSHSNTIFNVPSVVRMKGCPMGSYEPSEKQNPNGIVVGMAVELASDRSDHPVMTVEEMFESSDVDEGTTRFWEAVCVWRSGSDSVEQRRRFRLVTLVPAT